MIMTFFYSTGVLRILKTTLSLHCLNKETKKDKAKMYLKWRAFFVYLEEE